MRAYARKYDTGARESDSKCAVTWVDPFDTFKAQRCATLHVGLARTTCSSVSLSLLDCTHKGPYSLEMGSHLYLL